MSTITSIASFTVPLGGQQIELQQIDYVEGGLGLLRTRIREKSRFTVFDIDPATALQWGLALQRWAQAQPALAETTSVAEADDMPDGRGSDLV